MDTINSITSTASKIIWGEGDANETAGKEPVSGQQGKGTVTEPYDQGNADTPTTTSDNKPTPPSTNPTPSTNMSSAPPNPVNAAAGGEINPDVTTDKTGVTEGLPGDPPKGSDVVPSESAANPGAAPESGAEPHQKQQGGDRPLDEPREPKKDDFDDGPKDPQEEAKELMAKRDPNDHSGEPMKMHGASPDQGEDKSEGVVPNTQEERRESKVGMPGGQEHGKDPKGTGEEYVKTSGLAADGGDFDATKPGAGREADRLMEEKGIKKEGGGPSEPAAPTGGSSEPKEKVPLSEKIKTKLHIGHKDK